MLGSFRARGGGGRTQAVPALPPRLSAHLCVSWGLQGEDSPPPPGVSSLVRTAHSGGSTLGRRHLPPALAPPVDRHFMLLGIYRPTTVILVSELEGVK